MSVGSKLRELRGNQSKSVVAKAVGVSESAYVKYERDERVPRDAVKMRIASYFNKTVQEIFFSSNEHK
jgi:DNA-binding XRE family transcriptional regulator